jgi:hypothetical protein
MPKGNSERNQRAGETLAEKLDHYTDRSDPSGCWIWTGARYTHGYGSLWWQGKAHRAHKLAWEEKNGAIPDGLLLRHDCDNKRCVNPGHMRLGTHADNARDRVNRNRQAKGEGNGNARLSSSQAESIREDRRSSTIIAAEYGISPSLVSRIRRGELWAREANTSPDSNPQEVGLVDYAALAKLAREDGFHSVADFWEAKSRAALSHRKTGGST